MTTPRIIEVGERPYKAMLMLNRRGWAIHVNNQEVAQLRTLTQAVERCRLAGIADTRKQVTIS